MNDDVTNLPGPLAHLPAIYQEAATDPAAGDRVLLAFMRAYEAGMSSIQVTIDDLATYLDPLTAPALPEDVVDGVPEPTAVATLKAMVVRARAMLKARNYPATKGSPLEELLHRAESELARLADTKTERDKLIESAWDLVIDLARCSDPVLAAIAVGLARRRDMPPAISVAAIEAILNKATAVLGSAPIRSERLITDARSALAELHRPIREQLKTVWQLVKELKPHVSPSGLGTRRGTTRPAPTGSEPSAAPDFLTWLGTWVDLDLTDVDTVQRDVSRERIRRELVRDAAMLWRHRGTPRGLKTTLERFFDIDVDIVERAWPHGMQIGHSSTIGVDTVFIPDADLNRSFLVVWQLPPEAQALVTGGEWRLPLRRRDERPRQRVRPLIFRDPDTSPQEKSTATAELRALQAKAHKIYGALDRERPAHTQYYLAIAIDESTTAASMTIELHSTIGACMLT